MAFGETMEFVRLEEELAKNSDQQAEENEIFDEDDFTGNPTEDDLDDDSPQQDEDVAVSASDIFNVDDAAAMFVDAIDAINDFAMPMLFERQAYTKAERPLVRQILKKFRTEAVRTESGVTVNFTPQEVELLEIAAEVENYEENIVPLKQRERSMLKKPIKRLLSSKKVKVSPWTGIWVSLGIISLSRGLPILQMAKERRARTKYNTPAVTPQNTDKVQQTSEKAPSTNTDEQSKS